MEDLKTIETVDQKPFKYMCMTIGELPASFVDSMTYYECLAWLVNYLEKTVIPAVNNNAEALEELQAAFTTLKAYVDNYFDNLDVQEEINNKLDAMAEAGTLADIISQYLNSVALFTYDTVADMKVATNFVDGSYAKTLGYYAKGDLGGSVYKIRNITNDDTIDEATIIEITGDPQNNLVAELIPADSMNTKQFGIISSDSVDQHTLIQTAINYCNELVFCEGETYYITTALKVHNGTTLDLNHATIITSLNRSILNFETTDTYTGYNGIGDITIKNGNLTGGCISFIHGKNIVIENVNFKDTANNHFIEICACNNYLVNNCNFINTLVANTSVGAVNLDPCSYANFPYFDEESVTYDNTINEKVTVSNCRFDGVMRGIDAHGETSYHNKYVYVFNNYINGTVDTDNCDGIEFFACDNSSIHDNEIHCYRYGVMCYGDNLTIHDNAIFARKGVTLPPVYVYKASANLSVFNNRGKASTHNFHTACAISPNLPSPTDVTFVKADAIQDVNSSVSPTDDKIEVTAKYDYASFNEIVLMFGYPTGGSAGTLRTIRVRAFWDANGFINTQLYSLDELESGAKLHFLGDNKYRIENTTQTLRTSYFVNN